jgi:hypothetical protein
MRQGEVFGLAVEDIDLVDGWLHVRRQVKRVRSRLVYGLPKNDQDRWVPLPGSVAAVLRTHLDTYPPAAVTQPWEDPAAGDLVTVRLVLTSGRRGAINRSTFDSKSWRPALVRAGLVPSRATGMHALRHFFASALLDAGESIKALSSYLGHSDPGFTLRIYTHLMPASEDRPGERLTSCSGTSRPEHVLAANVAPVFAGQDQFRWHHPACRLSPSRTHALVAQRIAHLITDQGVGSSNLSGGTFATPHQGLEVGGVIAIGIWRSLAARVLGEHEVARSNRAIPTEARVRRKCLRRLRRMRHPRRLAVNGYWLNLVERRVRDAEAGGSNPSYPTTTRDVIRRRTPVLGVPVTNVSGAAK